MYRIVEYIKALFRREKKQKNTARGRIYDKREQGGVKVSGKVAGKLHIKVTRANGDVETFNATLEEKNNG